jgi:hypothetical protein
LVRFCARLSYQNEKFLNDLVKTPSSLHSCFIVGLGLTKLMLL